MTARTVALSALASLRTDGAWSDGALKVRMDQAGLDQRDAGLCTTLCCGVLQNQRLLDYYLDALLQRRHLQPLLRDILRLAAYQILFLDRVPDSAAVNEAVNQARKRFGQREAGLCNGLLRNLSRQKEQLKPPADYAIRYSHPPELVDLMKDSVGRRLGAILEADNTPPEVSAQWNPLRCTEEQLLAAWDREGVRYAAHPWLRGCWLLRGTGNLAHLNSFQRGYFQVQDAAARLSVMVLGLKPGMRVLDLCAAPGGKSIAAAVYMENQGEICACDVHRGKLPEISNAAERLGVTILKTLENDGTKHRSQWDNAFDAVIADVPCSGLGVIRKKPEIRYKDLAAMAELPVLQAELLEQAAAYVRPGGALLYSTCTILKRENEAVAEAFLNRHGEFRRAELPLPEGLEAQSPGMLTLYQGIDSCDGFFLCHMRKLQ